MTSTSGVEFGLPYIAFREYEHRKTRVVVTVWGRLEGKKVKGRICFAADAGAEYLGLKGDGQHSFMLGNQSVYLSPFDLSRINPDSKAVPLLPVIEQAKTIAIDWLAANPNADKAFRIERLKAEIDSAQRQIDTYTSVKEKYQAQLAEVER